MTDRTPAFARRLGAPPLDDDTLRSVAKPARYLGGEVGEVRKDLESVSSIVGVCYPDLYEIGMSHIGLKILYDVINRRPDWAGERVYAVARDMEEKLRSSGRPLTTLENRVPLKDLDVLGFHAPVRALVHQPPPGPRPRRDSSGRCGPRPLGPGGDRGRPLRVQP